MVNIIGAKDTRAGEGNAVEVALSEPSLSTSERWRERLDTEKASAGRIEIVGGAPAVVGSVTVKGQALQTILSEGSFNKWRGAQQDLAQSLGCRIATRDENLAYVRNLVERSELGTISPADEKALENYKEGYVRDTSSGVFIAGGAVHIMDPDDGWCADAYPSDGALFVQVSPQSKPPPRTEEMIRECVGGGSPARENGGGRFEVVEGVNAVVGTVTINGRAVETVLPKGSAIDGATEPSTLAQKLGCRLASREENEAYVTSLLERKGNHTLTEGDTHALKMYSGGLIGDALGGVGVADGRMRLYTPHWACYDQHCHGTLFVRTTTESK